VNCGRPDALRKGNSGPYKADQTYSYPLSGAIPQVIREIHRLFLFRLQYWAMTRNPLGVNPYGIEVMTLFFVIDGDV
jgi:hypothetical protein